MWTPSAGSQAIAAGRTSRLTRLSLLLAASISIWLLEALLLPSLPIPGAKFGFANVVTLLVIVGYGLSETLSNITLRVLAGSLVTGTLLGPAFLLAFFAGLAAALVMYAAYNWKRGGLSLVGVSVAGSVTHVAIQLVLAAFITGTWLVWLQAPLLVLVAVGTGCFNGLVGWLVAVRVYPERIRVETAG
ncbi:MAG: Gx transporter family protein [Actinobacteria bacterium]|nr:MAG: Gx transporter family protein [Actinomycetota bacterium]